MMDLKFIIPVLFFSLQSYASATADEAILDAYIQEGVKNNLALKQKRFQYEQANSSSMKLKGCFCHQYPSKRAIHGRVGEGRSNSRLAI